MNYQAVFKRVEQKYLLTERQAMLLTNAMQPYMQQDAYGCATISSLYFDTPDYRLIRRSIEKPVYKEKLRLRSYNRADSENRVYVELKKKYQSVVYKRRLEMSERSAMDWLTANAEPPEHGQIQREISAFRELYPHLMPRMLISYKRDAYCAVDGSDFRVTFDRRVLARQDGLSLTLPPGGEPVLKPDQVLLEIKTSGAIPLWMCAALSRAGAYKTSFSKYGAAYCAMVLKQNERERLLYAQ